MNAPVMLSAGKTFEINLASRAFETTGLLQFAWVFVQGESGSAKVTITDNNGDKHGPWNVPVPGVLSSVLRETTLPDLTNVRIEAEDNGFKGVATIELRRS